jgi:indole-3-glycerol phosphate synthase
MEIISSSVTSSSWEDGFKNPIIFLKIFVLPEHKKNISEIKMRELAEKYEGKKHGFYQALSKSGISIIGEFKNASPSLGKIKTKIIISIRYLVIWNNFCTFTKNKKLA